MNNPQKPTFKLTALDRPKLPNLWVLTGLAFIFIYSFFTNLVNIPMKKEHLQETGQLASLRSAKISVVERAPRSSPGAQLRSGKAVTPVLYPSGLPIAKSRDCVKVTLGKKNPQCVEIGSIPLHSYKNKKMCYNKNNFGNYNTILFQKIYFIEPTFFFAGSDFRWHERFAGHSRGEADVLGRATPLRPRVGAATLY
jgi:hypothetical protein